MSGAKKLISSLVLILLVYSWFFIFHKPSVPTPKQVLGTNTNITLFVEPEAGNKPILDAINNAQKEILVEVYLLSDKDIIASLENARARGVAVNVMLEDHPFGGGNINPKTKEELLSKDIKVAWSNPEFALTHEKAIIIDANTAFILSQNLTAASFTKNREFDVIDKNISDVTEIRNIFLADWSRESFKPTDTDLIESPDNSRVVLEALIRQAKMEIDIEVEVIGDINIINLLKEKAKVIPVKLILPTIKQISSNSKTINELSQNNVQVKTMTNPYVHGKTIIVDNRNAYIGSINFSSQSLDENRELGIILSDENALTMLENTFEHDWSNAQPVNFVR